MIGVGFFWAALGVWFAVMASVGLRRDRDWKDEIITTAMIIGALWCWGVI